MKFNQSFLRDLKESSLERDLFKAFGILSGKKFFELILNEIKQKTFLEYFVQFNLFIPRYNSINEIYTLIFNF